MKKERAFLIALALLAVGRSAQRHSVALSALRELARSVGFPDPNLAAAVAFAESGGNANAVGDLLLGGSYGLWQINARAHPQYAIAQLFDPTYNARAAFAISNGGANWNPWTTFRTGAFSRYL